MKTTQILIIGLSFGLLAACSAKDPNVVPKKGSADTAVLDTQTQRVEQKEHWALLETCYSYLKLDSYSDEEIKSYSFIAGTCLDTEDRDHVVIKASANPGIYLGIPDDDAEKVQLRLKNGKVYAGDQLIGAVTERDAANVVVLDDTATLAFRENGSWTAWRTSDGPDSSGDEALFFD